MKYLFMTEDGMVELEVASKNASKTVFRVKRDIKFVVSSEEWVTDVKEESASTAASFMHSFGNVRETYVDNLNPVMYPGGIEYQYPTKDEVQELLDTMNTYREEDLNNGEVESPYYRDTPFTIDELIEEIDLCAKPRD